MAKKLTLRQQIEERDAAYAELGEQNATLRQSVSKTQAAFAAKFEEADKLKESIALFKQEALQSAVREAELRGYIQRTLEDDAVRESGADAQPAPAMDQLTREMVRQNAHQSVEQAYLSQQPKQPVRTGPSPMARPGFEPNISYRDDCIAAFRNDPPSRRDPLGQRHWMER